MVTAIHEITVEPKPNLNSIRDATKEIRQNWIPAERLYRVYCAQRLQQRLWEALGLFETVEC